MTSARANRDSFALLHRGDPAPLRAVLRSTMDGLGGPGVVPINLEAQKQLVLGALVERFGGEVTGGALTRYLSHQLGWTLTAPKLIDVLKDLHGTGALSLEANGENDHIVRLLPDGADLYA